MIAESSTHRALFAPELLVLICQHLQAGILFNTIQVCKFWYSLLQPLLFVDLRISYETRQSEQEFDEGSIMMSYIRANMHKLRHVTIINTPIQDIHCFGLRNFKNLERFVWKGTLGAALSQTNSMLDFLSANASNLREVVFEVLRESARLWRVLAQDCSKLRSLSISKMRINDESDPWFWMACRNLVSLELRDTYHPAHWDMLASTDLDASFEGFQEALNIAEPRTVTQSSKQRISSDLDSVHNINRECLFPGMKRITLWNTHTSNQRLLSLMKQCPRLESIEWKNIYNFDQIISTELLEAISSTTIWPNLCSLRLPEIQFRDERLAPMILSLTEHHQQGHQNQHAQAESRPSRLLKVLQLSNSAFRAASFNALQVGGHFDTLVELDISSGVLTSENVLTILTTSSNLTSLAAPNIHTMSIMRDRARPWVCLNLQTWAIGIETYTAAWVSPPSSPLPEQEQDQELPFNAGLPSESELQNVCLQQLGRLVKLRSLDISLNKNISNPTPGLSLVLDKGLDHLARLSLLEELSFSGSQPMQQDIDWMAAHWKQLKKIEYKSEALKLTDTYGLSWQHWKGSFPTYYHYK